MPPPYSVIPLQLGEADVGAALDAFWSLTKEKGSVTVPLLAFLILGDEGPILVDTGMRDPARATEVHRLGSHRRSAEETLETALGRQGFGLADIEHCILTHLHYDHAGGCELLPNSRFYVQRSELAAAATPLGPRLLDIGSGDLFYDRRDIAALIDPLWPRVDLIEGDIELFPGIECVLYPDSHSPGSQCIYVQTADGVLALVGDIVRKISLNIDRGIPPGIYYNLESARRAMKDVRERADLIWPTHDPEVALGRS